MTWLDWNTAHAAWNFWFVVGAFLLPPITFLVVIALCVGVAALIIARTEK